MSNSSRPTSTFVVKTDIVYGPFFRQCPYTNHSLTVLPTYLSSQSCSMVRSLSVYILRHYRINLPSIIKDRLRVSFNNQLFSIIDNKSNYLFSTNNLFGPVGRDRQTVMTVFLLTKKVSN